MKPLGRPGMSYKEKAELWRRWKAGESLSDISRALAKNPGSVHGVLASSGGIISRRGNRSQRTLSSSQREEISRGLAEEETLSSIACRIGRAPSTVSREVQRNGGRKAYRAEEAEHRALQFSRRPKACILETNGRLRATVARKLSRNWSPQQVSGWLSRRFAQDTGMHVSHETIYRSLFIQARGVLSPITG